MLDILIQVRFTELEKSHKKFKRETCYKLSEIIFFNYKKRM